MKVHKLIVVDGLDNTGKSTLILRLSNIFNMINKTFTVIHLTKPPKDIQKDQISLYSHDYYISLVKQLINIKLNYDIIILDRGWVSEYVYGPMYRNRDRKNIIEDNLAIETLLAELFDIYMFILLAESLFLVKHDDDKSLSCKDANKILSERYLFEDGFNTSIIKNKYIVYANNSNEYVEILPTVYSKLINDRCIDTPVIQE